MLALKKVAVTGSIASGKSSILALFKEQGAYIVDADEIAHQLLDTPLVQPQIIQILGSDILEDGKVNRAKVSKIVFNDPKKLLALEQLLHPLIREEIETQFTAASNEKKWTLFVAEIALLFETNAEVFYDATVLITAPMALRKERYTQKHPLMGKQFDLRSARQLPEIEKIARADFVLENTGNLDELKKAFQNMYSHLNQ